MWHALGEVKCVQDLCETSEGSKLHGTPRPRWKDSMINMS